MKVRIVLFTLLITVGTLGCKKGGMENHPNNIPPVDKRWVVSTVAGNGTAFFADGPALNAEFRAPLDIAVSEDGIIYVADALNHRIRKIEKGQVSTFAGIGIQDTTSGIGTVAGFALPSYLAFDGNGNLFTLDIQDPRVRKISPTALVSVVAGDGTNGFADGRADTAQFGNECLGISLDEQGNVYVVDWRNRRIRKVSTTGEVTTIAGNGKAGFVNGHADTAQFSNPAGLVVDKQGNLYVGDEGCIRKITPDKIVSTFSGSSSAIGYKDGLPNEALFSSIIDMVIDEQGNIYASDENRIRKITPQGVVTTLAGSTAGYRDGDALVAKFSGPVGLAIDKQGNIYVADDHNNRIRTIRFE